MQRPLGCAQAPVAFFALAFAAAAGDKAATVSSPTSAIVMMELLRMYCLRNSRLTDSPTIAKDGQGAEIHQKEWQIRRYSSPYPSP
jgi:hypothetical protein